jgi:hypothetical protein
MSKVKVKKVSGGDKAEVNGIFNQILGIGAVNMNICYPKYLKIRELCSRVLKVLDVLANSSPVATIPEFASAATDIKKFIIEATDEYATLFKFTLSGAESKLVNLNVEYAKQLKEFSDIYHAVKESKNVRGLIVICNNLVEFKRAIENVDKLNADAILSMSGVEFCPLPFSSLNVKRLLVVLSTSESDNRDSLIKIVMLLLNKLYVCTYAIYQEMSSPDVDVDEFTNVVMNSLRDAKKFIPRCDKAFAKLEESVKLLKENFGNYYKDFTATKNQSTIIEHFILDVSLNTKGDAMLVQQFKKIIDFYNKQYKSQASDPRLAKLFSNLHTEMDKISENIKKSDRGENEAPADQDDDMPPLENVADGKEEDS